MSPIIFTWWEPSRKVCKANFFKNQHMALVQEVLGHPLLPCPQNPYLNVGLCPATFNMNLSCSEKTVRSALLAAQACESFSFWHPQVLSASLHYEVPLSLAVVGLWLQEMSLSHYKSICGIFVLTETSEVKMSVLSLPLQTGNYLLWCCLWQNAISLIPCFVFSLPFCLLYASIYFCGQHLMKPGTETDGFFFCVHHLLFSTWKQNHAWDREKK